jgi:hypothetical protein
MDRKVMICVVIIFIIATIATVVFTFVQVGIPESFKAVIVDNLALTNPNPDFKEEAEMILQEKVGLVVDYFSGDEVTVSLYQKLGSYCVVILRSHSSMLGNDAYLFTSENIQKIDKYAQFLEYLGNASLRLSGQSRNFIAVGPDFIRKFSEEDFHKSIIIAMGCNSSRTDSLAKAFIARGAKVFIGWDRDVTAEYTDNATLQLLTKFFIENKTVDEAIKSIPQDFMGGGKLTYYPKEIGELHPLTFIKDLMKVKGSLFGLNLYLFLIERCVPPSYSKILDNISIIEECSGNLKLEGSKMYDEGRRKDFEEILLFRARAVFSYTSKRFSSS